MNPLIQTPIKIPPHVKEILKSQEIDFSKQSINETGMCSNDQLQNTDYEYIKCAEEHFEKVYDVVNQARESMKQYRSEISDLKNEIIQMKYQIQMQSNQNSSEYKPSCERLWKIIQLYQPQNEVDTVYLKDIKVLNEQIAKSKQKLELMENSIGTYRMYTDYTGCQSFLSGSITQV